MTPKWRPHTVGMCLVTMSRFYGPVRDTSGFQNLVSKSIICPPPSLKDGYISMYVLAKKGVISPHSMCLMPMPRFFGHDRDKSGFQKLVGIWTYRECVRILDLRVQVHPGELWVSKQWVLIVLEASKSTVAKGDVPKIYGFVHPLHPC